MVLCSQNHCAHQYYCRSIYEIDHVHILSRNVDIFDWNRRSSTVLSKKLTCDSCVVSVRGVYFCENFPCCDRSEPISVSWKKDSVAILALWELIVSLRVGFFRPFSANYSTGHRFVFQEFLDFLLLHAATTRFSRDFHVYTFQPFFYVTWGFLYALMDFVCAFEVLCFLHLHTFEPFFLDCLQRL